MSSHSKILNLLDVSFIKKKDNKNDNTRGRDVAMIMMIKYKTYLIVNMRE